MTSTLIGRDAEVRALKEMLDRVSGQGQCLVLRGDPGIGKTALLRATREVARGAGFRLLAAVGVQSEAQLPFAGLHQVLRPLLRPAVGLPDQRRQALLTAFGLAEGERPDIFGIALAAVDLLAAAAAERPVAILVDDVQWLDAQSQEVLTFIAHRSAPLRIATVGAVRTGYPGPFVSAGLPELEVSGVDGDAAEEILRSLAGVPGVADRRRIRDHARGNPLALLELPEALAGATYPESQDWQPLTARLERAFGSRVAELDPAARDALLIAAVDPVDDVVEILSATAVLRGAPVAADVLRPAVEVGLVRVEHGRLLLRHPLVRSGVLMAETLERRHAANAAVAAVLDEDPYRRAWHRGQSIVGPDDGIADELEANAAVAVDRGAVMSAIDLLQRSAQLTGASAQRGHRLLVAAEHAFSVGRQDQVRMLVTAAERSDLSELDWARAQWLREIFNDGVPGDTVRVHQLCDVARQSSAAGDRELALNLLLGAALRCWWADTGPAARADVVSTAKALVDGVEITRDHRYVATLALAGPVVECGAVVDLLSGIRPEEVADGDALRVFGIAATAIGDPVRSLAFLDRAEALLRSQGRLALLSQVLSLCVVNRLETGDWEGAQAAAGEGERLAKETGQPIWRTGALACDALSSAFRGDTDQALSYAAEVEAAASRQRLNQLLSMAQLAKGAALSAAGRHAQAYRELARAFLADDPSFHPRERFGAVMFLAEAAVEADRRADANAVVAELSQVAARTPSPLLLTHLRYARAVLCDDATAGPLYADMMSQDFTGWPWGKACADLAHGGWLRRLGRHTEALPALRSAVAELDRIGARPLGRPGAGRARGSRGRTLRCRTHPGS
ncbi:AAA family ATPase [Streptacidiphilus sp. P02-A3a]|uniref:AAA family ATPase n=1 Tax=Streptacidiphilus sp. P02-A3a TaxID=2704468 RepID=UPI0015F7B102|nr:AAA family ATPase [Streptacidiphilus sp. P02-A3a]QMU73035.1 AAA family ATPase [Streptacidiphilus sp. P02-A3a]